MHIDPNTIFFGINAVLSSVMIFFLKNVYSRFERLEKNVIEVNKKDVLFEERLMQLQNQMIEMHQWRSRTEDNIATFYRDFGPGLDKLRRQ